MAEKEKSLNDIRTQEAKIAQKLIDRANTVVTKRFPSTSRPYHDDLPTDTPEGMYKGRYKVTPGFLGGMSASYADVALVDGATQYKISTEVEHGENKAYLKKRELSGDSTRRLLTVDGIVGGSAFYVGERSEAVGLTPSQEIKAAAHILGKVRGGLASRQQAVTDFVTERSVGSKELAQPAVAPDEGKDRHTAS